MLKNCRVLDSEYTSLISHVQAFLLTFLELKKAYDVLSSIFMFSLSYSMADFSVNLLSNFHYQTKLNFFILDVITF